MYIFKFVLETDVENTDLFLFLSTTVGNNSYTRLVHFDK